MYLNADDLNKLDNELLEVSRALVLGRTIEIHDPVDGWVETKQVNIFKAADDYRIVD